MSILNIALYGVSLARDEMDSRNEKLLRRCSNMKEIREKADIDEELKAAIQSSLKNVTGLNQDRCEKLSLKGQKFKILEAVSDEDLRRQFAFVHDIDPTLQLGISQNLNCLKRMTYKPGLRSISEQGSIRFRSRSAIKLLHLRFLKSKPWKKFSQKWNAFLLTFSSL